MTTGSQRCMFMRADDVLRGELTPPVFCEVGLRCKNLLCFFFPTGLKHQDSLISIYRSNHPFFCHRVQHGRALLITDRLLYNPHGYVLGTCLQLFSAPFQGNWRHLCLLGTWICSHLCLHVTPCPFHPRTISSFSHNRLPACRHFSKCS